jgi:hypothetical protein
MNSFFNCQKKFKLSYIDKIRIDSEPSLPLFRGSYAHEILEHNFDYNISVELNHVFDEEQARKVREMIKEFSETKLGKAIKALINHKDSVLEEDFAFTSKLTLTSFKDKNSWFRGSADLYNVELPQPLIVDYKTGKDKSEDKDFGVDQGMVYAIFLFIKFPKLMSIKAIFVFVEHGTKKEIYYSRDEFAKYMKLLYDKTIFIEGRTIFTEDVSALCEYCDYNNTEYCTAFEESKKKTESMLDSKISLDF